MATTRFELDRDTRLRPLAEVQHHNQSRAARAETLASAYVPRRPNGTRNRKTKPIIAAGVAAGLATIGVMGN